MRICAKRTDRIIVIGETYQTEIRALDRPNKPKKYRIDLTDQYKVFGQTRQTKIWVVARLTTPKIGYWPDRTDRKVGIGKTKQTKI